MGFVWLAIAAFVGMYYAWYIQPMPPGWLTSMKTKFYHWIISK